MLSAAIFFVCYTTDMLLILLPFIVVTIIILRNIRNGKFAIASFVTALFLGLASILLFESLSGPHSNCGVNDSVGPCDYAGRVVYDLPLVFFPTTFFWFIIVAVEGISRTVRGRMKTKR